MAIVRWDPFREVSTIQDQFNRVFNALRPGDSRGGTWLPAVDVYDTKDAVVLKADLAGLKPEDVQLDLEENVLTLSGERHAEEPPEGDRYFRVERAVGKFERSIALPLGIRADEVEATFEDGVLTVRLPKAEVTRPKRIPIEIKGERRSIGSDRAA
jgi:HSP20 family protein